MKKVFLFLLAFGIGLGLFAQYRPLSTKGGNVNFKAVRPVKAMDDAVIGSQVINPNVAPKSVLDDTSTMVTVYDLQTNAANCPRLQRFPDGTFGATCTWSAQQNSSFTDRGTGYNYFNGTAWGPQPTARVETSIRTGWPSYARLGANGEVIVAHNTTAGQPLVLSTRTTKGTGAWTVNTSVSALGPPAGAVVMAWPRLVTSGPTHNNIHIIALTEPTANGGTTYNGMDGALLYIRSTDGGATWSSWQQLPGMTSSQYLAIGGDDYAWAEPRGDTLAFTVGSNWVDQFVMKSTDNGTTWTKIMVWHNNYDLWPGNTNTDTFYCSDGNNACAIDKNGKVHVVFGRQRALGDNTGAKFWFPFTDGLIYWNEDKGILPQTLDWDTNYIIASVPDTMVFYQDPTQLAYYYNSLTSMPQIVIDDNNKVYVVYATVTLLLDPNNYMLRHLYARGSNDAGSTWVPWTYEITQNFFQYHWEECVFPSTAPASTMGADGQIFVLFQGDLEAGDYLKGSAGAQGQVDFTNNDMLFSRVRKDSITGLSIGIRDLTPKPDRKSVV